MLHWDVVMQIEFDREEALEAIPQNPYSCGVSLIAWA